MDSIKEFEQMEFFNLVDVEDFINSKPKDELDNYSFILGEINKVKRFLKYTNRNINNVYLKYYLEMEYFYFDGIFIFNLNLNVDENEFDGYKEYFLKMEERYLKSYEMGKISNLVAVIDKRLRVFIYRKFYDRLSEEERFKGFIYIYKSCENAQQAFYKSMLDEIAGYVPTHIRESRKNSKLVDKDGFITIFRGNGLKSTKAMSWTTDLKTAKFFAYRYDDDGYVVNGKVHVDDVIFIFDEDYGEDCKDSEKEILVVAGSVKNRKRIKTSKEK